MAVSCDNCGAEVDTDWQFCLSCGAALDGVDDESQAEDIGSPTEPSETDAREQRGADTDTSQRPDGLTDDEARARRKVTTAFFVGLTVRVALVAGGLLILELGR